MSRSKKSFDAVELMRSIRDQLTEETRRMSVEEQIAWLHKREISDPFLKRLADKACHEPASTKRAPRI
jgi:hypothetical protein